MLPDEVREAVERWDSYLHARATSLSVTATPTLHEWQTIRAYLLAREAEVEQLNAACRQHLTRALENGQEARIQQDRCERAEALLRECLTPGFNEISLCSRMRSRITAHLSENSRG